MSVGRRDDRGDWGAVTFGLGIRDNKSNPQTSLNHPGTSPLNVTAEGGKMGGIWPARASTSWEDNLNNMRGLGTIGIALAN